MRHFVTLLCLLALNGSRAAAQLATLGSLLHDGRTRYYRLAVPPSATATPPLVIVLHGGSGDALGVQGFTQFNARANEHGFVAVYPEGAAAAPPGYSWADGRSTTADEAGVDDVGFVAALIDTLHAEVGVDRSRVYVTGFSNGGFMTQRLACERPELFAAAAPIGSSLDTSLFRNCDPAVPIPILYVAGTADPEVPYAGGAMRNPAVLPVVAVDTAVARWAELNGCVTALPPVAVPDSVTDDNSTVERLEFVDCTEGASVRFFRVDGGGHTWPGVEVASLEAQLGETNEDIHASDKIWAFFRQFDRDTVGASAIAQSARVVPGLTIYPNPTSGHVQLRGSGPGDAFRVYDLPGREVLRGRGGTLDAGLLAPGTYIVRALHGGEWASGRLLRQ